MSFHRPFFLFGSFQKFVHELFSRIGVRIFYSLKQFGHANVEVWLCNDSGSIFSMNDSYIDVSRLIRSRRFVSYVFGSVATLAPVSFISGCCVRTFMIVRCTSELRSASISAAAILITALSSMTRKSC